MGAGIFMFSLLKMIVIVFVFLIAILLIWKYKRRRKEITNAKSNESNALLKSSVLTIIISISSFILIGVVSFILFVSLKGGRDGKLYRDSIGSHKMVNLNEFERSLINYLGTSEIYLDLNEDGTYELYCNTNSCLNKYRGSWDTDRDLENSFYVLVDEKGNSRNVPWLTLNIECDTLCGNISFERDVTKNTHNTTYKR